ncbi:MAG: M23 family metallopeptidase [Akkermansiaceae bacterium]|nr:M23 family metallopeptidase [Akkermansiaceae bacterium]
MPRFDILSRMRGYAIRMWVMLFAALFALSRAEGATMARMTGDGKYAYVPLADGFDYPVGKPDAAGYYKSRGLRLKKPRHLGEDWNGIKGGNSDLGDPVYTIGHGLVTYAADARGAWGKVVIVRHAFRDPGTKKILCCQTLYAHLDEIKVKTGQLVRRGDMVGTIGTNRGMYPAHLHAELHYNIYVNTGHQGVEKNRINYGQLEGFIKRFRRLPAETRQVKLPIGCFLPYKGTTGL